MPSKVRPSARRSHCSRPHGSAADERARPARAPRRWAAARGTGRSRPRPGRSVERWSATENSVSRSTSSPHRSMRTGTSAVDGNTSTIEPAHGDLAAVLDLVLAAVAGGRRARPTSSVGSSWSPCADDDRLDVLDVGAEPLHERPDRGHDDRGAARVAGRAGARSCAAGGPWSRRRADPLERQRLPGREQVDLVVAAEDPRGRGPAARRRAGGGRPRRSGGGWTSSARPATTMARAGSGTGERRRRGAEDVGQRRLVAQQRARAASGGSPPGIRATVHEAPRGPAACSLPSARALTRLHGRARRPSRRAMDRPRRRPSATASTASGDLHSSSALPLRRAGDSTWSAPCSFRRLADADADPQEVVAVQVGLDRPQAVVAGQAAADLHLHRPGGRSSSSWTTTSSAQVARCRSGARAAHRLARARSCRSAGTASARRAAADVDLVDSRARSLALQPAAVALGQQLDAVGARRCDGCPVLAPGVAQPDDQQVGRRAAALAALAAAAHASVLGGVVAAGVVAARRPRPRPRPPRPPRPRRLSAASSSSAPRWWRG